MFVDAREVAVYETGIPFPLLPPIHWRKRNLLPVRRKNGTGSKADPAAPAVSADIPRPPAQNAPRRVRFGLALFDASGPKAGRGDQPSMMVMPSIFRSKAGAER